MCERNNKKIKYSIKGWNVCCGAPKIKATENDKKMQSTFNWGKIYIYISWHLSHADSHTFSFSLFSCFPFPLLLSLSLSLSLIFVHQLGVRTVKIQKNFSSSFFIVGCIHKTSSSEGKIKINKRKIVKVFLYQNLCGVEFLEKENPGNSVFNLLFVTKWINLFPTLNTQFSAKVYCVFICFSN